MNIEWNISNWHWDSFKAAGKHVVSFAAGGIGIGLTLHFLTPQQAADLQNIDLSGSVNNIITGLEQVGTGLAGVGSFVMLVYNIFRSGTNATPKAQMTSVVTNLSAPQATQVINAIADPEGRNKLISAVAEMPEVKRIDATPAVARDTISSKVVSEKKDV